MRAEIRPASQFKGQTSRRKWQDLMTMIPMLTAKVRAATATEVNPGVYSGKTRILVNG